MVSHHILSHISLSTKYDKIKRICKYLERSWHIPDFNIKAKILRWEDLLDLEPFGSQWSPLYGERFWSVFIKNFNFFSTEERKTWTSWMTWG